MEGSFSLNALGAPPQAGQLAWKIVITPLQQPPCRRMWRPGQLVAEKSLELGVREHRGRVSRSGGGAGAERSNEG